MFVVDNIHFGGMSLCRALIFFIVKLVELKVIIMVIIETLFIVSPHLFIRLSELQNSILSD